jgi:hypothetical protein
MEQQPTEFANYKRIISYGMYSYALSVSKARRSVLKRPVRVVGVQQAHRFGRRGDSLGNCSRLLSKLPTQVPLQQRFAQSRT